MILDFQPLPPPLYLDISYLEDYRRAREERVPETARRYILSFPATRVPVIRLNSTARFKCCFHASNLSRLFLPREMKNLLVTNRWSEIVGWLVRMFFRLPSLSILSR